MRAAAAARIDRAESAIGDRLATTLFLAALVHGIVILGITFSAGGDDAPAPSLDVRLVAEGSRDEPRSRPASYLAQAARVGAGTTTERVAARTPVGPAPEPEPAEAGEAATPQREAPGARTEEPVVATWAQRPTVRYSGARAPDPAVEAAARALRAAERRRPPALLDSGGEDPVDRVQLTGPRTAGAWVSPDTEASLVAPYLDAWRRKVERLGTLNYPTIARTSRAPRAPILEIRLAADGSLRRATIRRSSGNAALDDAALQILRLAAPFDPFPADLADRHPVLAFAYEWQFEEDAGAASGQPRP